MPKTRLISPGSIPNHKLLKNLQLRDNYISNDGGNEGISVGNDGLVIITGASSSTALAMKESSVTPSAGGLGGYGFLWVKNEAPNDLYFTNDGGDDIQLTSGASTITTPADTLTVGDSQVNIATSHGNIVFKGTVSGTDEFLTFKTSDTTGNGIIGSDSSDVPVAEILGVSNQRLRIRSAGAQQNLQLFTGSSTQISHILTDEDYSTSGTSIHRFKNMASFTTDCTYDNDETVTHVDDNGQIVAGLIVTGRGIRQSTSVDSVTSDTEFELSRDSFGDAFSGEPLEFRAPIYIIPTIYLKTLEAAWVADQDWQDLIQVADQTLSNASGAAAQFRGSTSGVKCIIRMKTDSVGTPIIHPGLQNKGTGYTNKIEITAAEYNNESTIDHASNNSLALYQSITGTSIPPGAYIGEIASNTRFTIYVEGSAVNTAIGALTDQTLYARDRVCFQDPDGSGTKYMVLEVDYAADGLIEFGTNFAASAARGSFNRNLYIDMNQSNTHLISNQRMKLMSDSYSNNVIQLDADAVFLSGSAHTAKTGQAYTLVHLGDRAFIGDAACGLARMRIDANDDNRVFQITAADISIGSIHEPGTSTLSAGQWENAGGLTMSVAKTNGNTTIESSGDLVVDAEGGNLTLRNSATGDADTVTIESVENIVLDADGDNITMKAGSTGSGLDFIQSGTGDYTIKNLTSDKDIIFNVNDGGVDTEVMRFDGSSGEALIDRNSLSTTAQTTRGLQIDYDHTGSTDNDQTMIGLDVDVYSVTTTGGTQTLYGAKIHSQLQAASTGAGTQSSYGLYLESVGTGNGSADNVTGGYIEASLPSFGVTDTCTGLYINCEDGGDDLMIRSSANSGDFFKIQVGAVGATTFTTQDYGGSDYEADLTFNIDGFIDINSATGENITLDAGGDINLDAAADINIPASIGLTFGADTEKIEGKGSSNLEIDAGNNITLDAGGDIILNANGGNIGLADGLGAYTPTAASDATTKTYVDTQTVITATASSRVVNATTWYIMNNTTAAPLGGTDTTVGDTQDIGTIDRTDYQCLMAVIPYNMTVHAISGSVFDDDIDTTSDKRIGLWRLPSLSATSTPATSTVDTFTLAYITSAFAGSTGRVQTFHDTSADFALTAGDGIFMGWLNPQSGGSDDVALTMTIWAHQTTP